MKFEEHLKTKQQLQNSCQAELGVFCICAVMMCGNDLFRTLIIEILPTHPNSAILDQNPTTLDEHSAGSHVLKEKLLVIFSF